MLIDEFLPRYDVVARHRIVVRATADDAFAAVLDTDFGDSGLLRALLFLRALPGALLGGASGLRALRARPRGPLTLATVQAAGFRLLATHAPQEIVLGVEGRFWTLSGGRCSPSAAAFRHTAPAPGTARGVWNFAVAPQGARGGFATRPSVDGAETGRSASARLRPPRVPATFGATATSRRNRS